MTAPFELTGNFGGFVFTEEGKRRMLLSQGGQDRLLKVPRILRRRIIGKFRTGEPIRVAVTEERNPDTGQLKQIVSHVMPSGAPEGAVETDFAEVPSSSVMPAVSCMVRVCSKKNCWRKGGRELWEALRQEAGASGHAASNIEIRQVGCLDRCKQAPNVDCGNRVYSRCSPHQASTIIDQATGGRLRRETAQC